MHKNMVEYMCIPTDNRGMVFTDDRGKEFCFEQEGVNIWRSSFDSWLSCQSMTPFFLGVLLVCEAKNRNITGCRHKQQVTDNKELSFRKQSSVNSDKLIGAVMDIYWRLTSVQIWRKLISVPW